MDWIVNVLVSLVSGSVGSVVFAQAAARRSAIATTRYNAATTLRGVLQAYRHELDYQKSRVLSENRGYPPEFADPAGQERFAETVLRALPDLPKRRGRKLRAELLALVGSITMGFTEGRMYVPEASRIEAGEQARLEIALRRVTREPERYADGLLRRLLSEQNHHEAFDQAYGDALAALDRMAALVKP